MRSVTSSSRLYTRVCEPGAQAKFRAVPATPPGPHLVPSLSGPPFPGPQQPRCAFGHHRVPLELPTIDVLLVSR